MNYIFVQCDVYLIGIEKRGAVPDAVRGCLCLSKSLSIFQPIGKYA